MSSELDNSELVARLEADAGLEPGLLAALLALEPDFPELSMRGSRRALYREVEAILDAAGDRSEAA